MQDLKIAGIQSNLVWENASKNRTLFNSKINSINSPIDLIILPEMFTTGFSMNTSLAEEMDGETVIWMTEKAKQKKCCIIGSLMIKEKGRFYNRLIIANKTGEILFYDKKHLFTFAKEDTYFSPGKNRITFKLNDWKICPLTCYDLRFPVWSRNNENIDLYIFIANWPKVRSSAWSCLLQARAIENVSYLIGINRVGTDETNKEYDGCSAVIDYKGGSIFQYPLHTEHTEVITLKKEKQEEFRAKFPALNDSDSFQINS